MRFDCLNFGVGVFEPAMIICVPHSTNLAYLQAREVMTVISGLCLIYDATMSFERDPFLQVASTSY